MKRFFYTSIFLITACYFCTAVTTMLSFCIANYPKSSGWTQLHADNDARLIQELIPSSIILIDSCATKRNIVDALSHITTTVAIGDTLIIHFSGHGQQMLSPNSHEEADGVDETLVPFDAIKHQTAYYSGGNHFKDDDFGELLTDIRRKIGPHGLVIAVIDACHSGSLDKSIDETDEIYRGTDEIFGAENLSADELSCLKEKYRHDDLDSLSNAPDLSALVFISACGSRQRNYEISADGNQYGSLTYFFVETFKSVGLNNLSSFLDTLYTRMSSHNTMKFHGQRPIIRTTIMWQVPDLPFTDTIDKDISSISKTHPQSYDWIAWILIVIIIIGSIALWMKKKR